MEFSYDPGPITVLRSTEAVRKRPGMYVGNTGAMGVAHLAFELVANALVQHVRSEVRALRVQTGGGALTVSDDGRGLPPASFERFEELHHPDEYYAPDTHVAGHGLGLAVVSALSSALVATSDRERRWQQVFAAGHPVTPVTDVGPAIGRGTTIHLVPDGRIFGDATLPLGVLQKRLETIAVLYPDLAVELDGATVPSHGGLAGYARQLAGLGPDADVLAVREQVGDTDVEVAVAWGSGREVLRGFANGFEADGAHVVGLCRGLGRTTTEGRVALVHVRLTRAEYDGRTRRTLIGSAVRDVVRDVVRRARRRATRTSPLPRPLRVPTRADGAVALG